MLIGNGMLIDKVPLTRLGQHWNCQIQPGTMVGVTWPGNLGALTGIPNGYYPPNSILMSRTGGMLRARSDETVMSITGSASGTMGLPGSGSAEIGINTNTPDGQLVSTVQPGNAPASIGISTNNPALTASIGGTGSTTFGINTNTPVLGAIASLTADTTIGITGDPCAMLPTNDSSPLREASATFGLDGTLTRYAIGHMEGTTEEQGLTVNAITDSIWNAMLSKYTTTGTAGKALSSAGSGGVDYDALVEAINTDPNTLTIPKFIGLK